MTRSASSDAARLRASLAALLLVAAGALLLAGSCRSTRVGPRVRPVPAEASAALEEARAWSRVAGAQAHQRAWTAAARARELAPDWIAPRRLLDNFLLAELLGVEALAEHRSALERRPADAAELYLAGRLEGHSGERRFKAAAAADPSLAWAYHGLAHSASQRGDARLALRYGQMALERGRDPWERTYFTSALARYHVALDRPRDALALLEARLEAEEVSPVDHVELSVQAALIEMGMVFQPEYKQGYARALALLRESDLTDPEVEQLVERMRRMRPGDGAGSLELQLALASRPGAARDRKRADLMLEYRSTPLALALLRRSLEEGGGTPVSPPLLRAARFAAGQFALAIEEWLQDVPHAVLGADDVPRDLALRRVVECARGLGDPAGPEELARFGELLAQAGWFREARSVAAALAIYDLDRALALEDQAAAGQELLIGMRRLMQDLDNRERGESHAREGLALGSSSGTIEPSALVGSGSSNARGLREVLASMAPLVARAQALLGGETDERRVAETLAASPVQEYGGVGALVHPGPWFSPADEAAGLGRAGETVPGLAELLARLGRFGVVGQMLGGRGPDGTLLQRVLVEEKSGEHLGTPWSGTVVWCEGADLRSRAGRLGASISGAALHEGYWIDYDAVRRERDRWAAFQRAYGHLGGDLLGADLADGSRVERALAARGLALLSPGEHPEARRAERRDASTLLGQADRVRLAVLRDRARALRHPPQDGSLPPLVSLDELALLTSLHEEGHLCDRTRFLPLSRHLGQALRFLAASGFSPARVARRLEYRAELSALCEAPDPRVALVAILDAAEGSSSGITPHAQAYRELLADLLAVLDREIERDAKRWPEIRPNFVLAHQLHWLPAERLRELALKLARSEGIAR
jgi:hypothetical protein